MADPDLELREKEREREGGGGGGLDLLALLAFIPSAISLFLPKIRGGRTPKAPPVDPPLNSNQVSFIKS